MARRVRTEDAGRVYEERTGRSWREDSAPGLLGAIVAEAGERLLVALVDDARAAGGGRRLRARGAVPEWFREGLSHLSALVEQVPGLAAKHPLVNILTSPAGQPIVDGLLLEREEGASEALFGLPGMQALAQRAEAVVRRDSAVHGRKDPLMAFWVGVHGWLLQMHGVEVKPAEVALLAAATGLEPLDDGLDAARKRWEDRVRMWKRKLAEWNAPAGSS